MLSVNVGIAAVLVWGAFFYGAWRMFDRYRRQGVEHEIQFQLDAARWSDKHVEALLQRYPRSPLVLDQYVANALEREDITEALRRSDMFLSRAKRSGQAWVTRIGVLRRAGREEDAAELLREAMRRFRRDSNVLLAAGHDAQRRRDWAEAARRFDRLRKCDPGRMEGYGDGAMAYAWAGDFDRAEVVIAEAFGRLAHNWSTWRTWAELAEIRGDRDEAIRRWEAMRDALPGEVQGFIGGAEALAKADRAKDAAALIREAADYFPGNKQVLAAVQRLAPDPPAQSPPPTP